MSTFDPKKMHEAKRRKQEESRLAEEEEEARLAAHEREERARMTHQRDLHERHTHLSSYVTGIYEEVSKLSSKRPDGAVSKMTVDRVNRAIRDAQALLADENDPFIGDIEEFVPAGDLPESRDVVMVLRQIKDALDRMNDRYRKQWMYY